VGVVVVAGGFIVAARPTVSPNVVVGLLVAAAVLVIGIGVAGAVAGTREFHEHEEEGEHGVEAEGALAVGGAAPLIVEVAR
jgi:hypothetical protein